MSKKTIWINAGEVSGDMHGASLIQAMREIDPDLEFTGMGGSAMEAAGADIAYPLEMISLVGITEVVSALPRLGSLLLKIWRRWKQDPPHALVLIDCPDFNFILARFARRLSIPVYYYISPQVWAWRQGRVKFMGRAMRKVLCILPFEKDFYMERGVEAEFVGHPLLETMPLARLDRMESDPDMIGVFPGSRRKEVRALAGEFGRAARMLKKEFPTLKFTLALAPHMDEDFVREHWPQDVPLEILPAAERYEIMARSNFIMAASGTVALEAGLVGVPAIIAYKLSKLSIAVGRLVVRVKFISLPNLILDEQLYPEQLQHHADAEVLAAIARHWLTSRETTSRIRSRLHDLRSMMGGPGAPERAARTILSDLAEL